MHVTLCMEYTFRVTRLGPALTTPSMYPAILIPVTLSCTLLKSEPHNREIIFKKLTCFGYGRPL